LQQKDIDSCGVSVSAVVWIAAHKKDYRRHKQECRCMFDICRSMFILPLCDDL
jgi:hypothetical protein